MSELEPTENCVVDDEEKKPDLLDEIVSIIAIGTIIILCIAPFIPTD